ncbi:MAG TPA: serine hydrolase domain-containing protein [Acidimicrobiales bacterium]|jgi:CubicO group peptidase (beta-lactamase class C family)
MTATVAATGGTSDSAHGIDGLVEPGFEGVREAFVRNFDDHGELGAGLALYVEGRKVVDVWGGTADWRRKTPYVEDTLQLVFSTTKGITALCANLLAQRGELDFDLPVAHYWPEFAAAGKQDVSVRWLISHQAGLPYVEADLTLDEVLAWGPVVDALAQQTPVWEPGTAHGYHALTYGWLVGEVIRRITGGTVGEFVADELAGPLGLELWIGLPDEQQDRVAPLSTRGPGMEDVDAAADGEGEAAGGALGSGKFDVRSLIEQFLGADSLLLLALDGVRGMFTQEGIFNRPEVRAAELPAANAVTNARSLAKLYAATIGPVDGVGPLLTKDQLTKACAVQTSGPDRVLMVDTQFGLGYMRSSSFSPYGGPAAFGHSGAGGSMAFADPEHGIGFGYVMNRMMENLAGDPRTRNLVQATYDAIGVAPAFV